MSASRVRFLASKAASKSRKEESEEEDYDSEEERYQRNQERLLKKVEESASAIRALSKITRPFITGAWRLEREEQRQQNESSCQTVVSVPSLSKENKPHSSSSKKPSESLNEVNKSSDKVDSSRRKSFWSPPRHVKAMDVSTILEMEKTPSWKPLRKSKARQSLLHLNMENACGSPAVQEDELITACKPLSEVVLKPDSSPHQKQSTKVSEELRTPLRAVAAVNQALERRRSSSSSFESNSIVCRPSHVENQTNSETETKSQCQSVQTEPSDNSDKISNDAGQDPNLEKLNDSLSRTSSFNDEEEDYPLKTPRSKLIKTHKSPARCSPILLKAFGEEHSVIRGSIGSPDKVVNLDECSSPKDPSKVLKGVVAYVEVRRGEDDRTGGFRWKLKQLGASVSDTLNKKVTHVVFQEGLLSTFRKAKQLGTCLVSTHWVMACDESFTKVDETRYPIEKLSQYELADPLQKCIKRPKIMSPDLGSGRDEKVLSRRLQRRSVKVNSPLTRAPQKVDTVMNIIKTPSPLKSKFHLNKSSPKSKLEKDNPDSDDDWDGFLAMVEAQVREKASSRRKAGEINETPKDFETRLQQLLGRGEDQGQSKKESNLPLASIFHKGKVANQTEKTASKATKKNKSPGLADSSASSSVMMNWLQRRSPESGELCGKRDLLSASAAAAASAAADEILQRMLKKNGTKSVQPIKKLATPQKLSISTNEKNACLNKSLAIASARTSTVTKDSNQKPSVLSAKTSAVTKDSNKKPFVLSAKTSTTTKDNNQKPFVFTGSKGTLQSNKQPMKNKKLDFQGSAACSGAMRNWLSGMKSPPQLTKVLPGQSSNTCSPKKSNDLVKKRKAASFEIEEMSGDSLKSKNTSISKKHCGEQTPTKKRFTLDHQGMSTTELICTKFDEGLRTPTKVGSASKNNKKSSSDLTPRRRSMRLTPSKCTSLPNSITPLETVEEDSTARFNQIESYSPRKLSSSKPSTKKTPIKCRDTPLTIFYSSNPVI